MKCEIDVHVIYVMINFILTIIQLIRCVCIVDIHWIYRSRTQSVWSNCSLSKSFFMWSIIKYIAPSKYFNEQNRNTMEIQRRERKKNKQQAKQNNVICAIYLIVITTSATPAAAATIYMYVQCTVIARHDERRIQTQTQNTPSNDNSNNNWQFIFDLIKCNIMRYCLIENFFFAVIRNFHRHYFSTHLRLSGVLCLRVICNYWRIACAHKCAYIRKLSYTYIE